MSFWIDLFIKKINKNIVEGKNKYNSIKLYKINRENYILNPII